MAPAHRNEVRVSEDAQESGTFEGNTAAVVRGGTTAAVHWGLVGLLRRGHRQRWQQRRPQSGSPTCDTVDRKTSGDHTRGPQCRELRVGQLQHLPQDFVCVLAYLRPAAKCAARRGRKLW
uniref:Uncharacterized protein n=1 Tax=Pyrodinium bahamense TaxID=73915 RepID=A0A7S0FA65_9DINO